MVTKTNSEKGQALVFLVVGIAAFLGFVALAIDGGMAYSDRRHTQNAADASSLAGGGEGALYLENQHVYYRNWDCQNNADIIAAMSIARDAAIERAGTNSFTIDEDPADFNGVTTECGEFDYGWYLDRYIDVTVQISSTTETSFAQLLFPDALNNRVEAVTRIRPRQPLAFGNAIVALNPADCSGHSNGAIFHGTSDVYVENGGVFTNGCLRGNGHPNVIVTGGGIYYGEQWEPGNANWIPAPNFVDYQIPPWAYDVDLPNCSDPAAHHVSQLNGTLDPGLYCVNGNLHINAHDTVIGEGVTIYVPNGEVRINGNALIQLSAPLASPDPYPAIPGVLFYVPNGNGVEINGNSDSWFVGTILAPDSDIDVEGNGIIDAYKTQVIGWNVDVGGTAFADVYFEDSQTAEKPTSIELFR